MISFNLPGRVSFARRASATGLFALGIAIGAAAQAPAPPARTPKPLPVDPAPIPPALSGPVTYTCGPAKGGEIALTATSLFTYTSAGFDFQTAPASVAKGVCSSDKIFFLSLPLPEGNYRVTTVLGGPEASVITVRAEARRLMLENIAVKANGSVTKTFDVNTRVPQFNTPDGTASWVRLKDREIYNLNWDKKLTIEFNGTNPSFRSITITPLVGKLAEPVIYLAGDSTMVDQDSDPWASWGQQLTRFFLPGVVVANEAESGEASNSFVSEQRFAKVMSVIKPGDYFFVQFAHNDQKEGADFPEKYRAIMTDFVNQVRAKGATPVIVTAMVRQSFDADGHIKDTLAPYPQISREVAKATGAALIDLNAMAKTMFETMGPVGSNHAYMHFDAGSYPGVARNVADTTHFQNFGAYELARCIVQGIRDDKLPIAKFIDPAVPAFDPAKPDNFAEFHLPYTPPIKKEDVTAIPQANLK